MVSSEEGPFGIFDRIRFEMVSVLGDHWITRGLHCPLCISFWMGFLGGLFFLPISLPYYVLISIALSGATTLFTMVSGVPSKEEEEE